MDGKPKFDQLTCCASNRFRTFALLKFRRMNPYTPYRIPFLGLKIGRHDFEFELDDTFFASFEYSEISGGKLQADLLLDKQGSMMVLDFHVYGTVSAECDRCGDPMEVDVEHTDRLIVKYGDQTGSTEDEILVLGPSEHLLELHQYLYEYAHLGLPSKRVHDDEADCNQEALARLDALRTDDTSDDDDDEPTDPRWEALKKLK